MGRIALYSAVSLLCVSMCVLAGCAKSNNIVADEVTKEKIISELDPDFKPVKEFRFTDGPRPGTAGFTYKGPRDLQYVGT